MAEKWMHGNKVNWKPATRRHAQGIRNYKPNHLFKDSDRDGVPNVFDCKPFNKRKQDVIAPFAGSMPVSDMWGRQENARRNREFLRAQELALEEARRLNNAQFTIIDQTRTEFVNTGGGRKDKDKPLTGTKINGVNVITIPYDGEITNVGTPYVPEPTPTKQPTQKAPKVSLFGKIATGIKAGYRASRMSRLK